MKDITTAVLHLCWDGRWGRGWCWISWMMHGARAMTDGIAQYVTYAEHEHYMSSAVGMRESDGLVLYNKSHTTTIHIAVFHQSHDCRSGSLPVHKSYLSTYICGATYTWVYTVCVLGPCSLHVGGWSVLQHLHVLVYVNSVYSCADCWGSGESDFVRDNLLAVPTVL